MDGILIASEAGWCVDANAAASELLGRHDGELVGHEVTDLVDRAAGLERFWHHGRPPEEEGVEAAVRPPEGERRPIEVAGVIEVKPALYMIVIRNRAGEKNRDEQGAMRRLAGKLAHDLGNQLMVISSYTEMILEEMAAADPMRKQAREVLKASSRAIELTHQLLALDRKKNGT